MATTSSLILSRQESPEINSNYLSEHRYLRSYAVPLSRQKASPAPLGLRRSVSLEDTSSTQTNLLKPKPQNSSNLSLPHSTLSSSLTTLCVKLKPHQLLSEFNQNIAISSDEHQFDWWESAAHLRSLLEKIILYEQYTNEFTDDENKQDKIFNQFKQSKRNGRRNAVCFAVDRLCYNEQLILFVAISKEIQIEYNLMSSGFKM